jgi:opacity protein-like surface antigen
LIGVEAGYQFNEHFRAGVSLDYMTKFSFTDSENDDKGELFITKWKIKSLVTMVNAYYDIVEYNGFAPYLTLGAGISRNKVIGMQYSHDYSEAHPSRKKVNFVYKVGLGTRYSISENIAFDLRYQFVDLGKIKSGYSNDEDCYINVHKGRLRANQFLVGVIYKF